LSGVSERPMIIRMARLQQRCDHRLRDLVQRTGDVATDLEIPRSTARGWLDKAPKVVVGLDVTDLRAPELQQEGLRLDRLPCAAPSIACEALGQSGWPRELAANHSPRVFSTMCEIGDIELVDRWLVGRRHAGLDASARVQCALFAANHVHRRGCQFVLTSARPERCRRCTTLDATADSREVMRAVYSKSS
jgi:hypothetical protein